MENIDILDVIHKIPLPVITRMKLERRYIITAKAIKQLIGKGADNISAYYPIVRNNRLYGNEQLLRTYSGREDYLTSIIEHGVYFGNNTQKVGNEFEWELGCILTYGDYRKNLINEVFPDYYCETIGVPIHYAKEDKEFRKELELKIDTEKRTLLFFPVHGNEFFSPVYDIKKTICKVIQIANQRKCYNIIMCVYHGDVALFRKIAEEINEDRVVITTCGNRYDARFLCRHRSMIQLSDLTASNSLGTHLGYCIYLNKPHILIPQSFTYEGDDRAINEDFGNSNRSVNWKTEFAMETERFRRIFNESQEKITQEQLDICDYYWGFSKIKSPKEISNIYDKCREYTKQFQRRIRFGRSKHKDK